MYRPLIHFFLLIVMLFGMAPMGRAISTITEQNNTSEVHYYHYDNVGSTIALTNGTGAIMERIEYEPYGTILYRERMAGFNGTLHDTPYLFAGFYGCQTDKNGLIYLRERYYNPLIKRFINADPAREGWNWYAYANGDPLNFVDPTGLGIASVLDTIQTGLSILGMVPGVGEIFDVLNAGVSVARNNYTDAAINIAAAIPGLGNIATGTKLASAGIGATIAAVKVEKTVAKSGAATLYHYTGEANVASILKNGLSPGRVTNQVFTTPNGSLTPLQAQIELALPPNRGLPGALLKIDANGLEKAGIKPIYGPARVLPTSTAPGGGIEIIFNQPIPPKFIQQVY